MKIEWKTCFKIVVSLFVLYLCIHYWPNISGFGTLLLGAAMPLVIGGVIAYPVNLLMSGYEKHFFARTRRAWLVRARRPICMAAAFLTLAAVIALVVLLIVPQLVSCVQIILAGLPGFIDTVLELVEKYKVLPEDALAALDAIDWKSQLGQILKALTSGLGSVMDVMISTVSSVFSGIVTALLSLIFAIYLLSGKEQLAAQFHKLTARYLKDVWRQKLDYLLTVLNDAFRKYIVGQCVEAVILGVLCMIGMLILQLPYAAMVSALIAFTALIPVAGAYIGAGIGAFMILMVSPIQALIFLIFIVVLQQLEGNLIYPRVVGSSLGLPGIWVLAAVTVGGGIMGVGGMLLGVPLTAAIYRLLKEDVNRSKLPA